MLFGQGLVDVEPRKHCRLAMRLTGSQSVTILYVVTVALKAVSCPSSHLASLYHGEMIAAAFNECVMLNSLVVEYVCTFLPGPQRQLYRHQTGDLERTLRLLTCVLCCCDYEFP